MVMKVLLNQIANIVTGLTFNGKASKVYSGDSKCLLMQLGNLDAKGNVLVDGMISIPYRKSFENFLSKGNTVVFRGRGAGIVATVMSKTDVPIVVTSPLMIIRPNIEKIDPRYLVWSLTNAGARRYYAEHLSGSSIFGIGKRDLDLFEIDLPPMDVQKTIGKMKELESEERAALKRYQTFKSKLLEKSIMNAICEEKNA
jgi:restriction endonuclease S subunit